MYNVYILQSLKDNSYYIGSCHNLEKRLKQHITGQVKSTKRNIPWKLIYQESFENLSGARKRESQIKSWKKRKAIEKLFMRARSSAG